MRGWKLRFAWNVAIFFLGCLSKPVIEKNLRGTGGEKRAPNVEEIEIKEQLITAFTSAEEGGSAGHRRRAASTVRYNGQYVMDRKDGAAYMEWKDVVLSVGGQYRLTFRYGTKSSQTGRGCSFFVDGARVDTLSCPDSWVEEQALIDLGSGTTTVRVQALENGPNLDVEMEMELVTPVVPKATLTQSPTMSTTAVATSKSTTAFDGESRDAKLVWMKITSDDFEDGFGTFTTHPNAIDAGREVNGLHAHTGKAALVIQDDTGVGSSVFHKHYYDISEYSELRVQFYYYARSLDNANEGFHLEYNTGKDWELVQSWKHGQQFQNGQWYGETVSFDLSGATQVKLRFRSDSSANSDKIYIDDVVFSGLGEGTLAPTSSPSAHPTPPQTGQPSQSPSVKPSVSVSPTLPLEARVWANITVDNFEDGYGSFTVVPGTNDAGREVNSIFVHGGDASIVIQDNSGESSSFFHREFLDVSQFAWLRVKFFYYPRSLDGSDEGFYLEYNPGDGRGWLEARAWRNGIDFDNSQWYEENVVIDGQDIDRIKLRFRSDASANSDKIYIDDVFFSGSSCS